MECTHGGATSSLCTDFHEGPSQGWLAEHGSITQSIKKRNRHAGGQGASDTYSCHYYFYKTPTECTLSPNPSMSLHKDMQRYSAALSISLTPFQKVCISSCKFPNISVAGKKWEQERGREEGRSCKRTLKGGIQLPTWCHVDSLCSTSASSKMTDELW